MKDMNYTNRIAHSDKTSYEIHTRLNELIDEFQTEDLSATKKDMIFQDIIELYEPVVDKVVDKMKHNSNIDRDDLKQEAMIVLYECCKKFNNKAHNNGFYAYYQRAARNRLEDYIYTNQSNFSVSSHKREIDRAMSAWAKNFYNRKKRWPMTDEYVSAGFNIDDVKTYQMVYLDLYMEQPTEDDFANEADKRLCMENNSELKLALDMLPDDWKDIIIKVDFEGYATNYLGKLYGISGQAIRKKREKALKRLKQILSD